MKDGHMCSNGIEHMDAWENVSGSIRPVEKTYHSYENVVLSKSGRAEKVPIRIESGYDQEQSHTNIKEYNISVKVSSVSEEEPDIDGCDICEPEEIGDDEIFAERNIVIQRKMYYMVRQIGTAFQPDEPGNIPYKIQDRPYMGIVFKKCSVPLHK